MTDLHAVFSLAQPQQTDECVLALRSDAGVLVLGVVQQNFDDRFDQTGLQSGSLRLLTHPPQHALRHQTNVTRLVLQTLWEEPRQTVSSASLCVSVQLTCLSFFTMCTKLLVNANWLCKVFPNTLSMQSVCITQYSVHYCMVGAGLSVYAGVSLTLWNCVMMRGEMLSGPPERSWCLIR